MKGRFHSLIHPLSPRSWSVLKTSFHLEQSDLSDLLSRPAHHRQHFRRRVTSDFSASCSWWLAQSWSGVGPRPYEARVSRSCSMRCRWRLCRPTSIVQSPSWCGTLWALQGSWPTSTAICCQSCTPRRALRSSVPLARRSLRSLCRDHHCCDSHSGEASPIRSHRSCWHFFFANAVTDC